MLKQKLASDQMSALKSHDSDKLTLLRYILAQLQNKEIAKKSDLTDEETVTVLKKITKELQESLEAAEKGGRDDLINQNKKQIEIIKAYLPEEISDEELKKEIQALVEANQEAIAQNPKAIIGICMKELKAKADPSRIMTILKTDFKL